MAFRPPTTSLLTSALVFCLFFGGETTHAQPPSVTDVHVFLSPNDVFELAQPIWTIVYFDRAVTVNGMPQLALTIGAQERPALFVGLALTSPPALLFRYTVAPSDNDADVSASARAP